MKIECRPISAYPVPETRNRRPAQFHRKVDRSWSSGRAFKEKKPILLSDNLDLLEREALHLGCKHLIIEADFKEGQIRQDGWPRADAKPSSPRVVISLLSSHHGPLRYPCDTFTRFEDNIRAVGLALQALRTVDRYGVTRRGEQYAGWKALPASTDPTMTAQVAAEVVQILSGSTREEAQEGASEVLEMADHARGVIREALRRTHPDTGGSAEAFHQVQTARKVLTAHHGVSL